MVIGASGLKSLSSTVYLLWENLHLGRCKPGLPTPATRSLEILPIRSSNCPHLEVEENVMDLENNYRRIATVNNDVCPASCSG